MLKNNDNIVNEIFDIFLDEQILPVANAGSDISVTLPERTVILNGSLSYDGFGIRQYEWIKSDSSPAIGKIYSSITVFTCTCIMYMYLSMYNETCQL